MTVLQTDMAAYYQARAREYEGIYAKPERQADLATLAAWLLKAARGRTILEVACGTGYWTAIAARSARSILATDINAGPLEVARGKGLGPHVVVREADLYKLPPLDPPCDAVMAHFWWSHLARDKRAGFITAMARHVGPGGRLLMIDNAFVEGSSTPISRTDEAGNTYQTRRLASGATYEVIKNFPSNAALTADLAPFCSGIDILRIQHFWAVSAELNAATKQGT